ncbi:EthD domain-containing protein [Bosea sp. (in: a-proteobacteria)]|uniref:EthD domain-containing protein n=1 Tax=Bosea sp. (in: a-proteobacteria) TaxID=1871050 RepID=UPI00262E7D09|nr:EthD domain-containing protein [Bosea sp. (in: a-proteobacteria)]MCO5091339.1 EthD domain-containing protein [Bosea sp. (in: a-proteobacteria)]
MYTRLAVAPRKAGVSRASFAQHWREVHGPSALHLPGLRRYVQNHPLFVGGLRPLPHPNFDLCAELDFDDAQSMRDAFASEGYKRETGPDAHAFVDMSKLVVVEGDRIVRKAPPAEDRAVKLITFLRRRSDVTPGEFRAAFVEEYADRLDTEKLAGHEQVVHREFDGSAPLTCDAADIVWFSSLEAALAHVCAADGENASAVLSPVSFGSERILADPIRFR